MIREAVVLRGVRVRMLISFWKETHPLTFNFVTSLKSLCMELTNCSLEVVSNQTFPYNRHVITVVIIMYSVSRYFYPKHCSRGDLNLDVQSNALPLIYIHPIVSSHYIVVLYDWGGQNSNGFHVSYRGFHFVTNICRISPLTLNL